MSLLTQPEVIPQTYSAFPIAALSYQGQLIRKMPENALYMYNGAIWQAVGAWGPVTMEFDCVAAVAVNDFIYLDTFGIAQKANAALGFETLPAIAVVIGKTGAVKCYAVTDGEIMTLAGLTPGDEYYLGKVAGTMQSKTVGVPSRAAGFGYLQRLGTASLAGEFVVDIDSTIHYF